MKTHFHCPHCTAYLRIREDIIFKIQTKDHKMGILLLNPELGNYSYISSPDLKFEKGEQLEFMCPVCCENLAATGINKNLVSIIMINENKEEYNVCFSSIVGEHTTFKIEKANVVEKYGEDSSTYLDYFTKKLKLFDEKNK